MARQYKYKAKSGGTYSGAVRKKKRTYNMAFDVTEPRADPYAQMANHGNKRRRKKIAEDDPRWNWRTMGNHRRGRRRKFPRNPW